MNARATESTQVYLIINSISSISFVLQSLIFDLAFHGSVSNQETQNREDIVNWVFQVAQLFAVVQL